MTLRTRLKKSLNRFTSPTTFPVTSVLVVIYVSVLAFSLIWLKTFTLSLMRPISCLRYLPPPNRHFDPSLRQRVQLPGTYGTYGKNFTTWNVWNPLVGTLNFSCGVNPYTKPYWWTVVPLLTSLPGSDLRPSCQISSNGIGSFFVFKRNLKSFSNLTPR